MEKLCNLLLPKSTLIRIRYFTAIVSGTPNNPNKRTRQELYHRALFTLPNLSIHLGYFLTHKVYIPLANPPLSGAKFAQVIKTEEKGSDVNIATYLLCDGFDYEYDLAVIISNDSDLVEPVKIIKSKLGKKTGVINPHKIVCKELKANCDFYKPIRKGVLQASQFPAAMQDKNGVFTKPKGW